MIIGHDWNHMNCYRGNTSSGQRILSLMIRAHVCACDAFTTIVSLGGVSKRPRVTSLTQTKAVAHLYILICNHCHRQQLCGEQGRGFGDAQTLCVQSSRSQPYVNKYSSRRWSTWSKSNHTAPIRMLDPSPLWLKHFLSSFVLVCQCLNLCARRNISQILANASR